MFRMLGVACSASTMVAGPLSKRSSRALVLIFSFVLFIVVVTLGIQSSGGLCAEQY